MIKKKRFIHNALILTLITFLLRLISTAFSVYLSNCLTSEGVGLYQLAGSIYQLAVTLCLSGITVSVTRIAAEQLAQNNEKGARFALRRCLFFGFILSIIAAVLLFFLSPFICQNFLHESRVIRCLQYLSFSLPFLSLSAILRGYFLGTNKLAKASSGDIAQQLFTVALTVPILTFSLKKGLESACCGLVIASVLSEIISCIYSFLLYAFEKKRNIGEMPKNLTKQIFSICAPIAASNYIRSALTFFENSFTPLGLRKNGSTKAQSLSKYGMIKGMVMPILFFPSAVLSAFSSMLIPEVSGANAINRKAHIDFIINKCLQTTLLFSFLVMGFFFCFAKETAIFLYKNDDTEVYKTLIKLVPLVPMLYLDQIVDSILKGLNQQVSAMKYNTADSFLRIALVMLLVPIFGLNGYIVMFYCGTIFNATMSIRRLLFVSHIKFRLKKWVIFPTIAILISCVVVNLLYFFSFFTRFFLLILVYMLMLLFFSCIKKSDFKFLMRIFFKK